MTVRFRSCPFDRVEKRVPPAGRILDLGCGHGLFSAYLAVCSQERTVIGVDIDDDKLAIASRAAASLKSRLSFRNDISAALDQGPYAAIVVVDVLYLLPAEAQQDLVRRAAAALEPGGSLLIKEMATRPTWKFAWNRMQETAAVRLFKITQGAGLHFVTEDAYRSWMQDAGLTVVEHPLHGGYLHPHHLFEGRKP
jgi:2-polyprenyl-3-methyl-5-hydroxy-6-metoxy-1,4-benzoquinol methylase